MYIINNIKMALYLQWFIGGDKSYGSCPPQRFPPMYDRNTENPIGRQEKKIPPGAIHHDDASWLLRCAHAHDGCHADGGALEVDTAVEVKNTVELNKYVTHSSQKGLLSAKVISQFFTDCERADCKLSNNVSSIEIWK